MFLTVHGEKTEKQKNVLVALRSLVNLGTWNGTRLVLVDKTENVTELLNDDTPIEYRIRSPNISCIQPLKEGFGKQRTYERNIELLLRTVISVNQLSIYGAIADLCKELNEDSESSKTFDIVEQRPHETDILCREYM